MSAELFTYCAEAEPRLLELQAALTSESIQPLAAAEECRSLVGIRRFNSDYLAAQIPCPPDRAPELFRIENFERAHPRDDPRHRLYGNEFSCRRQYAAPNDNCGCTLCACLRVLGVRDALISSEVEAVAEAQAKERAAREAESGWRRR